MGSVPPPAPVTVRLWSLSEDVLVEDDPVTESLIVVTRWGESRVDAGAAARALLRRLVLGPVSLANVLASDADPAVPQVLAGLLETLRGAVVHSLGLPDGQAPLLSATPAVAAPSFRPTALDPARPVRLSRFASLRPQAGGLLVEAPDAAYRVLLHEQPAVRITAGLAAAGRLADVAGAAGVAAPIVADVLAFLVAAGVAQVADPDGRFGEDTEPALTRWAHHELLFHMRTRTWHVEEPAGLRGGSPDPKPAQLTRAVPPGRRFHLYRPDLDELARADESLTALLEADHHCPTFATRHLTAGQVGELLFRSARVRSTGPALPPSMGQDEATQRPYFNIACRYELELYVSLNRCAGLPRAIYHYDPSTHSLTMVREDPADLATLLDLAKVAAASSRQPAALITMTARMERLSPVFGGASYATALMHVGALQQTLYLCAKAMGLTAHGVVVDASDTVDRLLPLEWPGEVGVGECVVDLAP